MTNAPFAPATAPPDLRPTPLLRAIASQWEARPDAIAGHSIDDGRQITYGQLDERSAAVANHLRALGVGNTSRVGIISRRDTDLLVGVLGSLRAGAAYVPIEPSCPSRRAEELLRRAEAEVVLTGDSAEGGGPWQTIRHRDISPASPADRQVDDHRCSTDLAYVLFTSGSTGIPKAVGISDGNLDTYTTWAADAYGFSTGGRTLVHSPVTFDFTVTTLLAPLRVGGTVELLADDRPARLVEVLRSHRGFEVLKLTPTHLDLITRVLEREDLLGLARTVVLGGEALYWRHVTPWLEADPDVRFLNEYGPTEATVGCCVHPLPRRPSDPEVPVPIGRPVAGATLHVVDRGGRPVEPGAVGEVWISGPGVADGYLDAGPDQADRFRLDPRWGQTFVTGDLARDDAGDLVYLGRIDDQVKIRGHRVELAEVEAAVSSCPGVRTAVVCAVARRGAGKLMLVAHVVPEQDPVPVDVLRNQLAMRVPDYLIPATWTWIEELPLTPNGKVDRRALALPGRTRPTLSNDLTPPSDALEATVAALCVDLLDLVEIGIHDSLLDLGADSLTLAQLSERISSHLTVELPLEHLFDKPSVAAIADNLRTTTVPGP